VKIAIMLESLGDRRRSAIVFESVATLGANGYGGESVAMTAGFVVPPGVWISAESFPPIGGRLQLVRLRGYLAPDK
jgi:hypothetical protein